MTETDPASAPGPGRDDPPDSGGEPTQPPPDSVETRDRETANPFLSHLQSLRELQITLSQEGRAEAILADGTTGTVEIVGADCAVALVEPSNGLPPLRFGWIEGKRMAQHEIAIACRRHEDAIGRVRSGRVSRLVVVGGSEGEAHDGALPETGAGPGGVARPTRFASTLVLGIDASVGSRGVLLLARHDPQPFSREQVLLADILATLMAIQVERALRATDARLASERIQQDCEAATRHLRETTLELEAIDAVTSAASPSLDLDRQMEITLRKTLEVTRFKVGAIFLAEEQNGVEVLRFARGVGDSAYLDRARPRLFRKREGIAGRVWDSGEPLICADVSAPVSVPGAANEILALRRAGYRALACVPLRARGRVLGTMELLSSDARPELENRPAMAQAIAGQIAIVIQNGRLLSDAMNHCLRLEAQQQTQSLELKRWRQGLLGLQAMLATARRPNDLREMIEGALARALDLLGFPAGTVHLVDPGGRALHPKAHRGLEPGTLEQLGFRLSRTIIGKTLETGEPRFTSDDESDALEPDELRFRAAVPLRAPSGVYGVLAVAGRVPRVLDEAEAGTLTGLGGVLGLLVENARAFQGSAPGPAPTTDLPARMVHAQKMESIGTLAGGIAHEFNNILTAILGYASHIRELTTSDNPIHRQATTIEEQSRRAAELTQQLLAFAQGGQYTLEPLDMNQAIVDTVSFLSKSIDPRIVIDRRLASDLPEVQADAGQIRQVLVSLAVNSAEAMPEGGRITFETRLAHLDRQYASSRPDLEPGDYVEVVVGDTGVGMTPEVADRVFEPFFTTKTDAKGTGLGLSVVYGIVRSHRGHVTLKSTPDLGTTVRVYLPVLDGTRHGKGARGAIVPAVSRPPARPVERPPAVPQPFERVSVVSTEPPRTDNAAAVPEPKARILMIDDEEPIRDMARELLVSHGYEVLTAADGVEALEVYRQHWGRIDLVLLDVMMPRLGGLETYRRLTGMDRNAKILLCSGYSESDKAQRVLKEGALGLLQKPFAVTELLGWLERVLGKK